MFCLHNTHKMLISSQNVDVDILTALMCADSLIREMQRNRPVRMSITGRDFLLTEHHGIPKLTSSCAMQSHRSCRRGGLRRRLCVYVSGGDIKAGSR